MVDKNGLLITGTAGVGKSTLTSHLLANLSPEVCVLRGRATSQQLGAYEAFIDPIRMAFTRYSNVTGAISEGLSNVLANFGTSAPTVLVPSRTDPVVERRVLFDAVADLFSLFDRVAIYLDDLHWADDGTLALLAFIAAHPKLSCVTVFGTVRTTDVTPSTGVALAELRRHAEVVNVRLQGLSTIEVDEFVTKLAGSSVSGALVETVRKATNGNPLFAKELTEHLLQSGFDPLSRPSVPDGIRQTIELRVLGLSKEGQALLRAGAVVGDEFDVADAGELVSLRGEELIAAVEDGLLSKLIVERGSSGAAFSHGLVATVVYDGMSSLRKVALHRSAAARLIERNPASSADIVAVARHLNIVASNDGGSTFRCCALGNACRRRC
ncbi:MAG: AAA family ATPase [Aquincola sp.]|nr:AAA family ATPase [Aquincola sp.]